MRKRSSVFCRSISIVVSVLMLIMLMPIHAFAASNHSYTIGFVDANGNRLYGTLEVYSRRDNHRDYYTLNTYNPTKTFTYVAEQYYDITFSNDDGYYRFFSHLDSRDITNTSIATSLLKVPYTVTVKNTNGQAVPNAQVRVTGTAGGTWDGTFATDSSGQCTIYAWENGYTKVEVYDGYNWQSQSVKPTTPGAKSLSFTIVERVSVPVKVKLGGSELDSGFILTATDGVDTVTGTGSTLMLKKGSTYSITAEHDEFDGIFMYSGAFSGTTTGYTVNASPTEVTVNAKLAKPKIAANFWAITLEDGSSLTLTPSQSTYLNGVSNKFSTASYSYSSDDTDVVTISQSEIKAVTYGSTKVRVKVTYGTDSAETIIQVNAPDNRSIVTIPSADTNAYVYDGTEKTYSWRRTALTPSPGTNVPTQESKM